MRSAVNNVSLNMQWINLHKIIVSFAILIAHTHSFVCISNSIPCDPLSELFLGFLMTTQINSAVYFPTEEGIQSTQFSSMLREDLNQVIGSEFREQYGGVALLSAVVRLESVVISPPPPSYVPNPPSLPGGGAVMSASDSGLRSDEDQEGSESSSSNAGAIGGGVAGALVGICFAAFASKVYYDRKQRTSGAEAFPSVHQVPMSPPQGIVQPGYPAPQYPSAIYHPNYNVDGTINYHKAEPTVMAM